MELLATLLETVSDQERIDEITRWMVDCRTDDALFAGLAGVRCVAEKPAASRA